MIYMMKLVGPVEYWVCPLIANRDKSTSGLNCHMGIVLKESGYYLIIFMFNLFNQIWGMLWRYFRGI